MKANESQYVNSPRRISSMNSLARFFPRLQARLQIATFGENTKCILVGMQNLPTQELVLLHYEKDSSKVKEFSQNISSVLGIITSSWVISQSDVVGSVIENVDKVIRMRKGNKEILINIGSGDKKICAAALLAAYLNGVKAFDVNENYDMVLFPFLKLGYTEVVSDAKIRILHALDTIGGTAGNLENLSKNSGFSKPLLSYHINGTEETQGLIELGLVDVEKLKRGYSEVTLSLLGRIFLATGTARESQEEHVCTSLQIWS